MACSEYPDGSFSNIIPLPQEKEKIDEILKNAKNLHIGVMDELDRHKQIIDEIRDVKNKLDLIIKHFNIVKIIGQ